jgi:hypothetical protein
MFYSRQQAESQTKQSNIHDPSSPLEAGLGIASEEFKYGLLMLGSIRLLPEVDMAGEEGIAPEGEGNCQVIRQKELNREDEMWWLGTYYPCCGCCG